MKKRMAGKLTPRFRFNRSNEFAKIRGKLGLSQSRFAAMLGVSKETLQNWEQGRREPTAAARLLLRVAAKHPDVLLKVAEAG
jgi:putative transcriptional regulator